MPTETQLAPSMWEKPVSKLRRIRFGLLTNKSGGLEGSYASWNEYDIKITEKQAALTWGRQNKIIIKKTQNFYYNNNNQGYWDSPDLALEYFKKGAEKSKESGDRSPNKIKELEKAITHLENTKPIFIPITQ